MARPRSPDRALSAAGAMVPLAVPLAAAALGLFLLSRLMEAFLSQDRSGTPLISAMTSAALLASPASPPPALASAGSAALAIDALAGGRYAQVPGATGVWPRRGLVERFRLDAPPRASASAPALSETSALDAVETARASLGREYRALEVLASRLVVARFLGPEEAGTSIEGGVPSQAGDTILAERPSWLILFKAEGRVDPPPPAGWPEPPLVRPLVELLLIDASTGALLLRPPAAPFADFESIQLSHHPSLDRTRPLNVFGDAAP